MFVNLSPSISFFSPALDFVRQDRLRIVVSCVALGILLVGAVYWIASHFWQNRQVAEKDASSLHSLFDASSKKQPETEYHKVKEAAELKEKSRSVEKKGAAEEDAEEVGKQMATKKLRASEKDERVLELEENEVDGPIQQEDKIYGPIQDDSNLLSDADLKVVDVFLNGISL